STSELEEGIKRTTLLSKYDYISLLIGVNNQYRGRSVEEFKMDFENLLKKAMDLCNDKDHIFIISIPDYSVTPFSTHLDKEKISREIDVFNSLSKVITIQYKVQYIDITTDHRNCVNDPSLIAIDGLHPSPKEY